MTGHRHRIGYVLPGLPQLIQGRRVEGGGALALWLGLISILVFRFSRVVTAVSGDLDERLALLTLFVGLAGAWVWSARDLRCPVPEGEEAPPGSARRLWNRFKENRLAVLGLALVVSFYLAAFLTPFLTPFDPAHQPAFQGGDPSLKLSGPSSAHPLGTDHLSRDILSRILHGARISLSIGLLAVAISVSVGTVLGAVAGYLGGWVDTVIMRFVDMVLAFPRVVLLIALVALFDPSIFLIVTALAVTQWPPNTRIVRGEILSLREREFSEAARALGFSTPRIIFRHLLPNALAPIIVAATLGIGNTIVLEAGLSFLGLGIQPPTPSWGTMVSDGRDYLLNAWWIATFPGLAIVLVVLGFNLVGDGVRDAMDPRMNERRAS
ncbi:MAG: ABC transporter permease [Gemmatimonadota bacterium]